MPKTRDEIEKSIGVLTEIEEGRLKFCKERIDHLLENTQITEDNLRIVESLFCEIEGIRQTYYNKVITLLKRGDQI